MGFGGVPASLLVMSGVFSNFLSFESIFVFLCFIVSIICTYNMPRKNLVGRKILGEILGFKKFIETAEKNRLEQVALKYSTYINDVLPYAYALGIDGNWIKRVEGIFGRYQLDWYKGDFNSNSFSDFKTTSRRIFYPASSSSGRHSGSSSSGSGFSGGSFGSTGGGGSW